MGSTICTSRSRPDCPIACTGIAATRPSRTSPTQAGVGVLDDTAQSLFADVDNDGDQDLVVATSTSPLLFINDGKGHFTLGSGRLPVRAAAPGRADVDHDGGLRPRRLSRSLSVRLLVFLRRRRGQGRHAGAVLRRAQRTAGRALSQRRPRAIRRRHRRRRVSTPATIAITSRPPGPTTTATAGRISWSRTTSGPRTCITTSGVVTAR